MRDCTAVFVKRWILGIVIIGSTAMFVFTKNDYFRKTSEQLPAPTMRQLNYKGEFEQVITAEMSTDYADTIYYNFTLHRHYVCENNVRMGSSTDGGWDVCLVGPYRLQKPCLVYSFGINNDFTFDDAISTQFGCTVRAFDPSMKVENHQRDPNIWFYKTGLGKSNVESSASKNGWRMRNFPTLLQELGDNDKIVDYLKIDIEGSEWESLELMFETDILQKKVKQLGIEIHLPGNFNSTDIYRRWTIMKQLETTGFKRWYWHFNHYGAFTYNGRERSCCYEMVYINTAFMKPSAR